MALLQSELVRLRVELGFHALTVDAEPYISYVSLFDEIIAPYLQSGASTTSSTVVSASSSPEQVTLTLVDGTGFHTGDRVVIDVDSRQESVTAQNVSGNSLVVLLSKAHTGTYPVTVEGGETLIREKLGEIRTAKQKLVQSFGYGALKSVDDISWYPAGTSSQFDLIASNIAYLRDELAALVGIESMWQRRRAAGQRLAVY